MPPWWFLLALWLPYVRSAVKYNNRIFVDAPVISFADPLKNGFRVILAEKFLKSQLGPHLLPTLFVRAIPLKTGDPEFTAIMYPDQFHSDKHINIHGLRERSWYYVCLEWENFNRHNETTGTSCRLYRTLDRFGKTAESTLSDCQMTGYTDMSLSFKVRTEADFPMRMTSYLSGSGSTGPTAAQTFMVNKPTDLNIFFPFLESKTNYGQLCFVEEPLGGGYTGMGRMIPRLTIQNCCMANLKTDEISHLIGEKLSKEQQVLAYKSVLDKGASTITATVLVWLSTLLMMLCAK